MSNFVFILPDTLGGVKTFVNNYAFLLGKQYSVKVVSYSFDDVLRSAATTRVNDNVTYINLKISKYITCMKKYQFLEKQINQEDILICNDLFELEVVNYFKLSNKIIYILHGDLKHYNSIIQKNNESIDLILCSSNGLKEKYSGLFSRMKFEVAFPIAIYNRMSKNLDNIKSLCCIFVGRFEYMKGADLFIDLVQAAKEKKLDIKWKVITPSAGAEKALLQKLNNEIEIKFDLTNNEVINELIQSDILVFPSRSEGFGIAIMEAMAIGVIPIALDIPVGIPDQIIHEYNGFLLKDWQHAVNYLEKLMQDRDLLNSLKNNATQFVREKFNPNETILSFLNHVNLIEKSLNKKFYNPKISVLEKIIPEKVFRIFKFIYCKLKYGNK